MQLYFDKLGSGPPVVILHGLFGSGDNWRSVARQLAEDYEVWTLDLRNHGKSPHAPEMDLSTMARDVRSLMAEQRLSSPRLLGHSLGGKVVMQLALEQPDLPASIIVVDIAPRAYEPRHTQILAALQSFDPAAFQDRRAIEELLAPRIPDLAVRRFLLKSLVRDTTGHFLWQLNLPAIAGNYPALNAAPTGPGSFNGPALFIHGELSDYLQESDLPMILSRFPQARLCLLRGADHWVHATAQDPFLECVRKFLQTTSLRREPTS